MSRHVCRLGVAVAAGCAVVMLGLGAQATYAADEQQPADDVSAPRQITPVSATKTKAGISFGSCHFQKTPPHEPRVRLECEAGEVVVAVFDNGIRCCELELE